MSITRAPRPDSNYYVLNKQISEDKRLSWAARGMLVYLLGKPDNWNVSITALINETAGSAKRTGRDGVYATIRELIAAGYVTRTSARGAAGEFEKVDYMVSEEPLTAYPYTAQPYTANPPLVSTETTVSNELEQNHICDEHTKPKPSAPAIPDWIPADEWQAFVEYRNKIKAPLTDHAVKVAIDKLDKFRSDGENIADVLNQTILSGKWTGLFPVRNDARNGYQNGGMRKQTRHERNLEIANELRRRADRHDIVQHGGAAGGHTIDGSAVEVDRQAVFADG